MVTKKLFLRVEGNIWINVVCSRYLKVACLQPAQKMTVIENVTAAENEAVEKLRHRMLTVMKSQMHNDIPMFYRFLKARDFNVDAAETMLRKHLDWIKEFKVDTIATDFKPPEALKYFPQCFLGFDKEGCPIKYYNFGNLDAKGVRKAVKFPDLVKFIIQVLINEEDILNKQNEKFGRTNSGTVCIMDMKNFSFSDATDKKTGEHAIYFFRVYQDNLPERLKSVYIVNVSPYFSLAFNFLKVFLASAIIKKIHICTADTQKEELLKGIDCDVLPAFLGGNKTDPDGDPDCKSFVNHGGKVPEQYFLPCRTRSLSHEEGVRKLVVPRASSVCVELRVDEPLSLLEWAFDTRHGDIAFGMSLRRLGQEDATVVPLLRLDTHQFAEVGAYQCEHTGTYVMTFDNSYSWLRSKELHYRAKVIRPQEYEARLNALKS